jgi:ketosteroid isomerase-like protein
MKRKGISSELTGGRRSVMARHMRLLAPFLLLSALAIGQDADVRAAEKVWSQAILARDCATLQNLLDDDLIYGHSTGIVDTKSSYLAKIASGALHYESVKFDSITIKLYGDTAVMHAHMHIRGINQNGHFDDSMLMMHVWHKSKLGWQLVAHQAAKLP